MKKAFSLVELSIVLVILGLLTGGILAGQSLIRASELRAISTEYQRYVTATHSFRDKYMGLPGDITNATAFWGAAHATASTCLTTVGTGTQTCNGDGSGFLNNPAVASQRGETFAFWAQLANAGLIEGSYSGFAGPDDAADSTANVNVPNSKLGKAIWASSSAPQNGYGLVGNRYTNIVDNIYNHLIIGGDAAGVPSGFVMKPEEAWNIDTKMDDGKPGMGNAKAFNTTACGTALDATASIYNLSNSTIVCWLTLKI